MTTPIITWQVNQMQCFPQADGNTNVVFRVNWSCTASASDAADAIQSIWTGASDIPLTQGPFTPYEQLTQEQVLGWVWGQEFFDKSAIEGNALAQLQNKLAPEVVTPQLPW